MKARLPYVAILGGSLAFLVSLYFAWVTQKSAGCAHPGPGAGGLLCLLEGGSASLDGWAYFGQVAALLALALAGAALAALARPHLASRLPLGKVALALGIFSLLTLSYLWQIAVTNRVTAGLAPGAYVGLVAVGVVCVAAAATRWGEIAQVPSAITAAGQLLLLGIIASFLLPAFNVHDRGLGSFGLFICAFACLGLPAWSHSEKPGLRLAVAAAIATLVAGTLLPGRSVSARWPYELWLLIACGAALLALALPGVRRLRLQRLAPTDLAVVAAGVLLLVALFLPWLTTTEGTQGSSRSGWELSAFAGTSVLALLVAFVWLRRWLNEYAIAAAIFVAASGLSTTDFGGRLTYGAPIGFAAGALLLFFALRPLRPIADRRFVVRLIPLAAAVGLLALEVAPLFAYFETFAGQSPWRWLGLLDAAVVVATLRLLLRWCTRPRDHAEVLLLPLALLVLTALDLIYVGTAAYAGAISWEGWVSVFLCLLLVGCGWAERYGSGLRIPEEIWRVDRISTVED